jgi:hypothetical protein
LHARYHGTDTWLRRNGSWQIVASQTHRYYEDPAVGNAEPRKFSAYLGMYELSPERKARVTTEGSNLFMERTGGKKVQLFPEAGDIFSAKRWKAAFSFISETREKSTGLSIAEIMKTSSGERLNSTSPAGCSERWLP